jgi:hypothetical protein
MMRKGKFGIGLLLIGLLLTFTGCTDQLGIVDLSGEIELQPDQRDWAYRSIVVTELRRTGLSPDKRLKDYREALENQKTVNLGDRDYMFVTKFSKGFPIREICVDDADWSKGFTTLIYSFKKHRLISQFISRQSETGDSWESWFDPDDIVDRDLKKKVLEREGVCYSLFQDHATGFDCIVASEYSIKSVAERVVADGKPVRDDHRHLQYNSITVQGNSEIKIGFRQCLSGTKTVAGKTIGFYVVDWNLDGEFDEADKVWCDYSKKMYNFGEEIRLTGSLISKKDNFYLIRLTKQPGAGERYSLHIELVRLGKRKN